MIYTTNTIQPVASGSGPRQSRVQEMNTVDQSDISEYIPDDRDSDESSDSEEPIPVKWKQHSKRKGKQVMEDKNKNNQDKGKGKQKQVEEEDGDEDESIQGQDFQEKSELDGAILGIAKVDLLKPLVPIKQGHYNTRAIDQKAVDKLVQSMELMGVLSDRYSTAIPILADPEDIDPSSISQDITKISQAPDLKLSEKGSRDVRELLATGGRHRTKALATVYVNLRSKIKDLEDRIKRTNKKSKLEELREEVKICQAKKASLGKWTVIVYNAKILRADGERLAFQLARNEIEVRKVEDDSEKSTMRFLEYRSRRQEEESRQGRKLTNTERDKLSKAIAGSDKHLKHCLQSEDVLTYWEALSSVNGGARFFNTTHFASKWSDKTIHQPGGGLFVEIVSEAAHFFRLLFTPCTLYLDQDPTIRAKYKDFMKEKKSSAESEKWAAKQRELNWNSFDRPKGEPDWSMVTPYLLDDLDELNGQWLESEGRTMFMDSDDNKMVEYWNEVRDLIKKYVVKPQANYSSDYKGEWMVAENIIPKLRWYKYEANIQNRLKIPILTPKMLDALAANIGASAKAYEEIALWLVPVAPYFISTAKHNLLSRSAWGLVWQHLTVHGHFRNSVPEIKRELTAMVMEAAPALALIKKTVSTGEAMTRNLVAPQKGEHYRRFENAKEYKPKGVVYEVMVVCRQGKGAYKSKSRQPATIIADDLPWPLSVPWSGSFLTSSNPARDFPRHGVYAAIEAYVVPLYRVDMIERYPEVGDLRNDISEILGQYVEGDEPFAFADGIETPETYGVQHTQLDAVLESDRLSDSFVRYHSEVKEIIRCCAKQTVMLAHPFGNQDSALVREAFEDFITTLTNNIPRLIEMEDRDVDHQQIDPYDEEYDGKREVWKVHPNFSVMRDIRWPEGLLEDKGEDERD